MEREGQPKSGALNLTLVAEEDKAWPLVERGLFLRPDRRLEVATSFTNAVSMAWNKEVNFIGQIYSNLRGFATGRIPLDQNLLGPPTIAAVAFNIAGENFYEFILFLAVISVNLAVINFLPIPMLDGGHMVFLIYELFRGKPASERVSMMAKFAGLAILFCLLVFVIYLEVRRYFPAIIPWG